MSTSISASRLVGLIGSGIQASRTPGMHEREAHHQGLPYVYRLLDLDQLGLTASALPELLEWTQRMGFNGLNITHPCKQSVIPLLDELSEDARAIGAVNTVVFENGKRTGHNTDVMGYAEGFKRALPNVGLNRVLQLGAGGGGSAVAHALITLGVEHLILVDTTQDKATELAQRLNTHFGSARARASNDLADDIANADGLVNATPVGMATYPGMPIDEKFLRPDLWVSDIIYFPMQTALLKAARALGCRTMDGSLMAVYQAVDALRLFSGIEPNVERMLAFFGSQV